MACFNTTCGGEFYIDTYNDTIESYGYYGTLMYRISLDEISHIDIAYNKTSFSGYVEIYLIDKPHSHTEEMSLSTLDSLIVCLKENAIPHFVHYREKPILKFERPVVVDVHDLREAMVAKGLIPANTSLIRLFEMAENGSHKWVDFEYWIEDRGTDSIYACVGKFLKEQLEGEADEGCYIDVWW